MLVDTSVVSVMAAYSDLLCMCLCVVHRVGRYDNTFVHGEPPHAQQVGICHHNTDNAHIKKHGGTIPVILARHRLWLPDDGSCVNRNMLEQLLHF